LSNALKNLKSEFAIDFDDLLASINLASIISRVIEGIGLSFQSINLNQQFWEELSTFHHIRVKEPHKSNCDVSFSLVMGDETRLFVEWNSASFSKAEIDSLVEKTISFLKQL
jgi:hypothetical protein